MWHSWRQHLNRFVPAGVGGVIAAIVLLNLVLTFYWSDEPALFDVRAAALEQAGGDQAKLVPGYVTTARASSAPSPPRSR